MDAIVLDVRRLLQCEINTTFAGLLRQVPIADQVEAELLAILFETVNLVQDSLSLVFLVCIEHRIDLIGLRDDFGRIEARIGCGRLLMLWA